jgi:hypothetical protein
VHHDLRRCSLAMVATHSAQKAKIVFLKKFMCKQRDKMNDRLLDNASYDFSICSG